MKEYNFKEIEKRWQDAWREQGVYHVKEDRSKPKYYVLDMFPYPSGAGLHVGHPLGYIASDIYSRFKRLKGYNVLHPMGYDAFGLPAEQYAIQTGQHPRITTEQNIARYREQLDKIGFSFDWEREVRTSDSHYYKWTQWIFLKLFGSWYNPASDKAEAIETLIAKFESEGFIAGEETPGGNMEEHIQSFMPVDWKNFDEKRRQQILLNFRLAYLSDAYVNWCPGLGTVLSNDEVKDGLSERGGYPVERKLMKQWSMRITAFANRLLNDLDTIDWSDSIKEAQRNWIGKSEGASIQFAVGSSQFSVGVFSTRPDTIFGATFLALAPEHELIEQITTPECKEAVTQYINYAKNRSERERQADVKKITGEFTGAYAKHPFTGKDVPIWIAEYVLAGYGTGAVMGVPAHDSRDYAFAGHFGIERPIVIQPNSNWDFEEEAYEEKEGKCVNSDFLNGLAVKDAIKKAIAEIEKRGIGKGKTNFRLRDAIFGRQRYWGEPIPIYYKDGVPYPLSEDELPLILPEVDKYLPTEDGEPPLARAENWKYKGQYEYEQTTMPGWAGSSWYFLRYMDPHNENEFASKEAISYWQNVDLYIGGSEHATGHLLYVRFWAKFLFDMGLIPQVEPAKKLINQGMIQGTICSVYWFAWTEPNLIISKDIFEDIKLNKEKTTYQNIWNRISTVNKKVDNSRDFDFGELYEGLEKTGVMGTRIVNIPLEFVDSVNYSVDIDKLKNWRNDFNEVEFICNENSKLLCAIEIGKMSKRWYNVINPDDIIDQYGADTLRLYEMFLGPLEQSKPWNTQGIEGVHRFLKKLWRLFFDKEGKSIVIDVSPDKKELKALHKLIKKVGEDVENFSFNTSVSAFMICVNELTDLNCHKKSVLQDYLICLSPYAPHIAEELWQQLGNKTSIINAAFPDFNAAYLMEENFSYPISINGKVRTNIEMPNEMNQADVEQMVLADEIVRKWLEGKQPKKLIFVKGRIVNIVV